MTDFLYSRVDQEPGTLGRYLKAIYTTDPLNVTEFHGPWGSIAVSCSRYRGFDAVETDAYICVVIGGPVLTFPGNGPLPGALTNNRSRVILQRWCSGQMDWAEDLSGPFVVLLIDKEVRQVICATDLLMLIPVYMYRDGQNLMLGTHADVLARACGREQLVDDVSLADFVLNDVVTYPYTCYRNIRQCSPATVHRFSADHGSNPDGCLREDNYWKPSEKCIYTSVGEAAVALRDGVGDYVKRATEGLDCVGEFITAGEDSRVLAGMLSKTPRRDAYIFLDGMNREGRIARHVAERYGATFNVGYRDPLHYLRNISEASCLIGSGHQYRNAHTLGFHIQYQLAAYGAVFGGYLSDTLLKAEYARKPAVISRLKFMPQWELRGETRSAEVKSPFFAPDLLDEITCRRRRHFEWVRECRPQSSHEWFELLPMTMRAHIPNLYCNRRLFASYEPFMSNAVIRVGASVPVGWKLNRRLFNRAFRRYLADSKWIRHSDGRLPYFPWWVNVFVQTPVWLLEKAAKRSGIQTENQGPWSDWKGVLASPEWERQIQKVSADSALVPVLRHAVMKEALRGTALTIDQKFNLLQSCVQFGGFRP